MKQNFIIQKALPKDAEAIYKVMEIVYEQLEDKECYVKDDFTYVKDCLEGKGIIFKCLTVDTAVIVAFLIVYFPKEIETHMGKYVDLNKEEYKKTAYMDSIAVLPEYRGNGLQKKLLAYAERFQGLEEYEHLMATVSPKNPNSLDNFLSMGYKKICKDIKYGGLERYILYKEKKQEKIG